MYSHNSDISIIEGLLTFLFWVFIVLLIVRLIRKKRRRKGVPIRHHSEQPIVTQDDTAMSGMKVEYTTSQIDEHRQLEVAHAVARQRTINDVKRGAVRTGDQGERAEIDVDMALQRLDGSAYIVFRDLIIPTGKAHPSLTQIDHVIVSTHGVFCIETKSNNGYVYGYKRADKWAQYLAREKYLMNSPWRQNMHHVKCLERYLNGLLRAPVHSYLAFPNARKVVIDGIEEDTSPSGIVNKVQKHMHKIYDLHTVERIAKSLAYMASKRDELRHRHVDEVKEYLAKKV